MSRKEWVVFWLAAWLIITLIGFLIVIDSYP